MNAETPPENEPTATNAPGLSVKEQNQQEPKPPALALCIAALPAVMFLVDYTNLWKDAAGIIQNNLGSCCLISLACCCVSSPMLLARRRRTLLKIVAGVLFTVFNILIAFFFIFLAPWLGDSR